MNLRNLAKKFIPPSKSLRMRNETAMEKRAASGTTYGGTNPAQTAAIRVLLGDNRSILANVISGRDSNATIVPHAVSHYHLGVLYLEYLY